MKSSLPIEARRPPREEVVDILAATLIQMLARGLEPDREPDRDDQPDKEEPAAEAEAEPCH